MLLVRLMDGRSLLLDWHHTLYLERILYFTLHGFYDRNIIRIMIKEMWSRT